MTHFEFFASKKIFHKQNGAYRSLKKIAYLLRHDLETHLKSYSRFNTKDLQNAYDFVEERFEKTVEKVKNKL